MQDLRESTTSAPVGLGTKLKRLALAGGGTGGHLVPGLHLLRAAAARGEAPDQVLWFTSGRAVENEVLADLSEVMPGVPIEICRLPLEGARGGAPSQSGLLMRTPRAVLKARKALRRHGSQALLGLGGFTALPSVVAARSLRIPVGLYEVNAVPGKATRKLGSMASAVFHAWPTSVPKRGASKHHVIGPVVGPQFQNPGSDGARARAREALGFDGHLPLLVILGGSQGAGALNGFMAQHVDELLAGGWQVLHQVGPGKLDQAARPMGPASGHYQAREYLCEMHKVLAAADFILGRGGASTLAEIAVVGVPTWVVPYPHHSDGHQAHNARSLGSGVQIVPQETLDGSLAGRLARLAVDSRALAGMRQSLTGFNSSGADELWSGLRASLPQELGHRPRSTG
ncbi:MAG: UDP-N-acetylglucosamine--N-acetylmuramyl-(pentapeptide) pyrophosphoryl-undecaprenol N-acetylglucosamine transferase [bacterium]|nr:UDP-N-acetylglucosamine--N-acetylmuramyl-(pentapeptide) pyrophosphoryl-undecaprenol N-acetylglucosamine transferase [bacterium]